MTPQRGMQQEEPWEKQEDEDVIHVFWLAGGSCDGCSIAVTSANAPPVEDLLRGTVTGLPRLELYHPVLSVEHGQTYTDHLREAEDGNRDPYVVIVEGSVPNEDLYGGDGYWISAGREDGKSVRMVDWLDRLAPDAAAIIAIGSCAAWGGIPAADGNPTDAMGTMDYLGRDYRSVLGLPVINVPGCAPIGDNFMEVVAHLLMYVEDIGPLPRFDAVGRPDWLFGETVHRNCNRGSYYEEGDFAEEYGSEKCLVEIGCWGPVVKCNMPSRRAVNGIGGCMNMGGKCIGCTMPGFPDKFTPYFKKPPGTLLSSTGTKILGGVMQRLRRRTVEKMDKEARWEDPGIEEKLYRWFHRRDSNYSEKRTLYKRPDDGEAAREEAD